MFKLAELPLLFLINFILLQSTTYIMSHSTRSINNGSSDFDLYNGFTKVTILNSTNFKQEIFGPQNEKFWFVEFYKHWCGHCIRFVPVLKAFAYDIYEWRDVVRIGTINCANDMNNEICRNQKVNKVPTLKIFPPNSKENFVEPLFERASETTVSEMREYLVKTVKSYHNSQERFNGLVNLKLLIDSDVRRLWNEVPSTVIYLIIVFEPKDSLVGSHLALDMSRIPEIQVRLVDPENKSLLKLMRMEKSNTGAVVIGRDFNTIFNPKEPCLSQAKSSRNLIEINDIIQINLKIGVSINRTIKVPYSTQENIPPLDAFLTINNFTREGLYKAVREHLIKRGIDIKPLPQIPIIPIEITSYEIEKAIKRNEQLQKALNVKHLSTVIFQVDLEKTISEAMTNEIPLKKTITGEELTAFRKLITVIIKYFPARKQGLRLFTEFQERVLDNKREVSGEDVRTTFNALNQKYNPFISKLEWLGCRGTIMNLRGYPCGLWTMFHTLVGLEELKDRNIANEKPEVLEAMSGYIKYFFSCSSCAEHFTQMAETIAGNVTTHIDAMMWLWRAHNNVNRRLSGDETEDPLHPKVQFPIKDACPRCYRSDGISWDDSEVFLFISNMVSHINHLNPAYLPFLLSRDYITSYLEITNSSSNHDVYPPNTIMNQQNISTSNHLANHL